MRIFPVAALSLAVAVFVGLSVGLMGSVFLKRTANIDRTSELAAGSMADCLDSHIKKDPTTPPDVYTAFIQICYSVIRDQQLLNDFQIRRQHYFEEFKTGEILLWLVVIITFSGVALAAGQLAASYRLAFREGAPTNLSSEIAVQRDKVVLRSSVTGLFILIVSFAFFLTFVIYIFRDREEDVDATSHDQGVVGRVLRPGGLEPPK
jgi:hypothetical protein